MDFQLKGDSQAIFFYNIGLLNGDKEDQNLYMTLYYKVAPLGVGHDISIQLMHSPLQNTTGQRKK